MPNLILCEIYEKKRKKQYSVIIVTVLCVKIVLKKSDEMVIFSVFKFHVSQLS